MGLHGMWSNGSATASSSLSQEQLENFSSNVLIYKAHLLKLLSTFFSTEDMKQFLVPYYTYLHSSRILYILES